MAAKIIARRVDYARRVYTVDIRDDFDVVTPHSFPLTGDHCLHCGGQLPGSAGTPDLAAAETNAVAHIDQITSDVNAKIAKLPDLANLVIAVTPSKIG